MPLRQHRAMTKHHGLRKQYRAAVIVAIVMFFGGAMSAVFAGAVGASPSSFHKKGTHKASVIRGPRGKRGPRGARGPAGSEGQTGAQGLQGPPGPTSTVVVTSTGTGTASVNCSTATGGAEIAAFGGGGSSATATDLLSVSEPTGGSTTTHATGWTVTFDSIVGGVTSTSTVTVYAICGP